MKTSFLAKNVILLLWDYEFIERNTVRGLGDTQTDFSVNVFNEK